MRLGSAHRVAGDLTVGRQHQDWSADYKLFSRSDWKEDDLDYAGLQKLFVDLNRKTSGSPHGKFWTKAYEESYPELIPLVREKKRIRCVAYDFGAKRIAVA